MHTTYTQMHRANMVNGASDLPMASMVDGVKVSPCKRRPDTGRECPIAYENKNNTMCIKCGLRTGFGSYPSTQEIYKAIQTNTLFLEDPQQRDGYRYERDEYPCQRPGCGKMIKKGRYCRDHGVMVRNRKQSWSATVRNMGMPRLPAPDEYLFADFDLFRWDYRGMCLVAKDGR